jgi:hypothetical protein
VWSSPPDGHHWQSEDDTQSLQDDLVPSTQAHWELEVTATCCVAMVLMQLDALSEQVPVPLTTSAHHEHEEADAQLSHEEW